jgi:predicted ATPase
MIRECLYTEVSTSRRKRLHETIGKVLEERYSQEHVQSMAQFSELAFHFTQSNDRKRSAIYSQQAAEQAFLSSAFKEAIVHYRVALKYMDADNEHRGKLMLDLGKTALLAGAESEAVNA